MAFKLKTKRALYREVEELRKSNHELFRNMCESEEKLSKSLTTIRECNDEIETLQCQIKNMRSDMKEVDRLKQRERELQSKVYEYEGILKSITDYEPSVRG